jgi:hypothetical protein
VLQPQPPAIDLPALMALTKSSVAWYNTAAIVPLLGIRLPVQLEVRET